MSVPRWVGVVPSIWPAYTEACVASMHPAFTEHVTIVDNTQTNHGVAGSWNVGARIVLAQRLDYLVIISATIRFGAPGGCDFVDEFSHQPEAWAVEADQGLGWHLLAFTRSTLERCGLFDENFWPAYGEDLDYGHRIRRAGIEDHVRNVSWPKVPVDAHLESVAHGIQVAHVQVDFAAIEQYLARKWGGHKDEWNELDWKHPFNDPTRALGWWPTPPDPRCYLPAGRPAWAAP